MTISRRSLSTVAVALALVLATGLTACGTGSDQSGSSTSGGTGEQGAPVAPEKRAPGSNQDAGDAAKVTPLSAERRSELASGFPIEVPVPNGSVSRAEAQGDSAWVYEMSVEAQPFDVAAWYRAAYASANWQTARDEVASGGGTLIFVKGAGAQSKIRLTAEPGGTKITASVGVGEAVGDTF